VSGQVGSRNRVSRVKANALSGVGSGQGIGLAGLRQKPYPGSGRVRLGRVRVSG
jgi:hypothetical protein